MKQKKAAWNVSFKGKQYYCLIRANNRKEVISIANALFPRLTIAEIWRM